MKEMPQWDYSYKDSRTGNHWIIIHVKTILMYQIICSECYRKWNNM